MSPSSLPHLKLSWGRGADDFLREMQLRSHSQWLLTQDVYVSFQGAGVCFASKGMLDGGTRVLTPGETPTASAEDLCIFFFFDSVYGLILIWECGGSALEDSLGTGGFPARLPGRGGPQGRHEGLSPSLHSTQGLEAPKQAEKVPKALSICILPLSSASRNLMASRLGQLGFPFSNNVKVKLFLSKQAYGTGPLTSTVIPVQMG